MYGLPQTQRVVRDVFRSPDLSGKEIVRPFPFLGAFRLGLLLWREGGLEVPDGEFDLVASMAERIPVGCGAPFAQTHR